jgi:hypothetical protein
MMPHIRTGRAKSDKTELSRAALVYCGPLKKSDSPALFLALIHRSAWKGYSANFALTEF